MKIKIRDRDGAVAESTVEFPDEAADLLKKMVELAPGHRFTVIPPNEDYGPPTSENWQFYYNGDYD